MGSESTKHDCASVEFLWQDIRTCLEQKRREVYEDLRNYPPPITACDQQFDFLLEKQTAISGELARLKHDLAELHGRDDQLGLIQQFIRSSSCLDEQAKLRIQLELSERVSKQNAN